MVPMSRSTASRRRESVFAAQRRSVAVRISAFLLSTLEQLGAKNDQAGTESDQEERHSSGRGARSPSSASTGPSEDRPLPSREAARRRTGRSREVPGQERPSGEMAKGAHPALVALPRVGIVARRAAIGTGG